ncbi:MAG: hypothetical protein Q8P59_11160, partial [Dehalococcoidia bacterium]|nr:hypothetical protein [Dehalococcoidia bacterium]
MSQVVYVEPTEELASVVQKLESAEEMDLVLLVPKGVALLKDLLQWNLLQRQVRALGKSVVVVTHDRGARFGARQAGFPVYRSLRRMKIKPGQSQPVPLRRYLKKGRGSSIPVVLVSVSLGALLFLALGAYLVLPTGAVSLKPVAQEIALTISVKASQQVRDVDAVASQIPARL